VLGAVLALCGVVGLGSLIRSIGPQIGCETVVARHYLLKTIMLLLSFGLWAAMRRPWAEMGICGGQRVSGKGRWIALACGSMILAAVLMILTGSRHPLLKDIPFVQIVLSVWLLSSVAEEVAIRGVLQSWIMLGSAVADSHANRVATAFSAGTFALMHAPLMWSGAGIVGGGILVLATLGAGLACAVLRSRSGSLLLPILAHVLANVLAPIGGIAGALIYRLLHGHLPTP
jgi:membrane protease YdiL (CAAX protease family)